MATLHYTSVSDLTNILPDSLQAELTDDGSFGDASTDSDRVEALLEYAESIAESYITNRYDIPLTTAPPSFVHAILVIAKYHLALRREFIADSIEQEYQNIIGWLTLIRDGDIDLPDIDADDVNDDVQIGFGDVSEQIFDRNLFNVPYDID